jgi:hypothetical protein
VGLDIGVFGSKDLAGFFGSQGLDGIDVFVPRVKAVVRHAFGVFVG